MLMIRLEESKVLGRVIRQDDIKELAISTWTLIRDAIRAGKVDEALFFLDHCYFETKTLHDGFCSFVDSLLTHIGSFDEEEVYKLLRKKWEPIISI
jgi:hypothetical protein